MPYRLKKHETVPDGVRRIATEQIESALANLSKISEDTETAVHEVRKELKKARALVRLVRDDLGEAAYSVENDALRDAGRRLATVRDSVVRIRALDALAGKLGDEAPVDTIRAIRRRLVSRNRSASRRLVRGRAPSLRAAELARARARVDGWPLPREGFAALDGGLRRMYAQGRRRFGRAWTDRTDEELHAWRRRAKDLRYHVELLHPIWPELMRDLETTLHDLTDRLGEDHDFAELRRTISPPAGSSGEDPGVLVLVSEIDRRRADLQQKARPIADRVYQEKPGAFVRRIEGYWTTWRGGAS